MSYKMTIEPMGNYLHVRTCGEQNYEVALATWREIVNACRQYQCYHILDEACMDNSLTTMDAWGHQQIFAEAGVTPSMKIAWVDLNPATYDSTKFVETVLLNRGLVNGRLFSSVTEAKQWLLDRTGS